MAKKSARSKGYRKQQTKKPYLSKKEIIILCAIVAVLIVGAIALFSYDDGALKVKDGAVVTTGDNWLIVNGSNVRGRSRYYKMGEIGQVEGYDRADNAIVTDPNVPEYTFTAADAAEAVSTITVTSSHATPEALANYASSTLKELTNTEVSAIQTTELSGKALTYFSYATTYEAEETAEAAASEAADVAETATEEAADTVEAAASEATDAAETAAEEVTETVETAASEAADAVETAAEEVTETVEAAASEAASAAEDAADAAASTAAGHVEKSLTGYVAGAHDSCIVIRAASSAPTADACASDEAMLAALEKTLAAITLEP